MTMMSLAAAQADSIASVAIADTGADPPAIAMAAPASIPKTNARRPKAAANSAAAASPLHAAVGPATYVRIAPH
jgi:hypothetical protein